MYKLRNCPSKDGTSIQDILLTTSNGKVYSIPFDPANTDYQQFKKDIMDGGELQDADGAVMSADAAKEFIKTLP